VTGLLVVLSGPSGVGKTTVADILLADTRFGRVVTATTRSPREGERDGRDYRFLSHESFREAIGEDALLEHAEVHGELYGTPREEVERVRRTGRHALLLIDVQGAAQVRGSGVDALTVFLAPPSLEELEKRLRGRGTESEESIRRRLDNARREMLRADEYDHVVVNDRADAAAARIVEILRRAADGEDVSRP
jgi:guanylate kinase